MKIEMSWDVNAVCDGYWSIKDGLVSDLPLYCWAGLYRWHVVVSLSRAICS